MTPPEQRRQNEARAYDHSNLPTEQMTARDGQCCKFCMVCRVWLLVPIKSLACPRCGRPESMTVIP